MTHAQPAKPPVSLPAIDSLCVSAREAALLTTDGEIKILDHPAASREIHDKPVLVCHAPFTCARLGVDDLKAFDVLELFAFVHPARFCVPTSVGLCKALGLPAPLEFEDTPAALMNIAQALLTDLQDDPWQAKADPIKIASVMGMNGRGWAWTPFIFSALGQRYDHTETIVSKADLNIWKHLPDWSEEAPPPPPAHHPVSGDEARTRLRDMLGPNAESRKSQMDYTTFLTTAFGPKQNEDEPLTVLAEAGTGVGKTLGYLAPASVWAEKNDGAVWVSTYTKNLQRQIDQELARLYPDEQVREAKTAVRKGRENYLCLLNMEEQAAGAGLARHPRTAIAAGIMARWAAVTKDGDMQGGDFPGWLAGLLGYQGTLGLADRRGECIYSACDHYHRCFVERSVRKSRHAKLVVANHALVMIQTATSAPGSDLPARYVFDEGHHLFDAADSAFAAHLTARETYDLRRWIRGNEGGKKSRAKGLKRRAEDLTAGDPEAERLLSDIIEGARILTAEGWTARLKDTQPRGPCETFILSVYGQVINRAQYKNSPYSLETDCFPVEADVLTQARSLEKALSDISKPMEKLSALLMNKLSAQASTLDGDTRRRIEAVCTSMATRCANVKAWIAMLQDVQKEKDADDFISWFEVTRIDGRTIDIGYLRHYIDPMAPFADALKPHAHGVVTTSATLRDHIDETQSWNMAAKRTGLSYLAEDIRFESFPSPFSYASQTRLIVIDDVNREDMDQVAAAYQTLFQASNGGALGLFTAIARLKAVAERITVPLEEQDISVYAQHIDVMDNGTLVDIFKDDLHACLLGTDAVRDGVDVPGESLRLIVFDRIPWPRPDILHRARRNAFGGKNYDDMIARLKLKQAFGRLIRRDGDKGVFVMLDSRLPSRLQSAFPESVAVQKIGLKDAAEEIKKFLA